MIDNYKIIFFAKTLFFIFVFFTWLYFVFPNDQENERRVAAKIEKMMKKLGLKKNVSDGFYFSSHELAGIKHCYLQKLNRMISQPNIYNSTADWAEVGSLPSKCANSLNLKLSNYIPTPKLYENKHFISPKFNDSCSVITFGIGHEVENEQFLRETYPQCSFLGFDPDPIINAPLFQQKINGHFVKSAVGGKTEKGKITRLDTTEQINRYEKIQKVSAASLIETYHGIDRPIDLVNFDIEGAEFEVFEFMPGDEIYKQICQFNVEFHHPITIQSDYSVTEAIKILRNFIMDGTFIWVRSDILFGTYFPSFFINVKNRYCFTKYLEGRIDDPATTVTPKLI